jgi:hypothetical protein
VKLWAERKDHVNVPAHISLGHNSLANCPFNCLLNARPELLLPQRLALVHERQAEVLSQPVQEKSESRLLECLYLLGRDAQGPGHSFELRV